MFSGVQEGRDIGLEIVSPPMSRDTAMDFAQLTRTMLGHVPQTARTSIHVHVDVGNKPWTLIRDILAWGYHLEAVLYLLAAGGGKHRGNRYEDEAQQVYNDYRFARPLSAPIGLHFAGKIKPMFNIEEVLNARSWSELLAAWGRLDYMTTHPEQRGNHYIPHRLSGVSIHSVVRQGTVEFRIWDGLYQRMPEIMQIVYRLYDLASGGRPQFEPMPIRAEPYDLSPEWLADVLGPAAVRLAGMHRSSYQHKTSWPAPVRDVLKLSHYSEQRGFNMPSLNSVPVMRVEDNRGTPDDFSQDFVPFWRP